MSQQFDDFPDVDAALRQLLRTWFPELATEPDGTLHVAVDTPVNLKDVLPFVRVADIGGSDDRITDRPTIDFDVFSDTFTGAKSLANQIRTKLIGYPYSTIVAGRFVGIDQTITLARPHRVPWADATIRRFYSSYQFSVRR